MNSEERSTPVNPKWGDLPDSLKERSPRRGKCDECGDVTTGAYVEPIQRLNLDGSLKAPAKFLCAECDPTSSLYRKAAKSEIERKAESYKSARRR